MTSPRFIREKLLRVSILLILIATTGFGCASSPPPAFTPPLHVSTDHRAGGPLAARTTSTDLNASNVLSASVQIVALDSVPANSLHDISPDVQLITSFASVSALLASSDLTAGCKWAAGDDATAFASTVAALPPAQSATIAQKQIAILAGTTTSIKIATEDSQFKATKSVDLLLSNLSTDQASAPKLQIAIRVVAADPKSPLPRGEAAVLNPITIDKDTPIAILIPAQFAAEKTRAVVAILNFSVGANSPEQQTALADAESKLKSAAATQPTDTISVTDWTQFLSAFSGMQSPATRRASLLYATAETHATICSDAALVADENTLAQLTDAIFVRLENTKSETVEQLGWVLDSASLKFLSQQQAAGKLSPEMLSVLIRHTGQAAQNTGSVDQLARVSSSRADFDARTSAENFVYLEDSSPAARVRAFDWLASRGKAPADYDPLGPKKDRRAAIEKAMDAMTAQANSTTQPAAITPGGKP